MDLMAIWKFFMPPDPPISDFFPVSDMARAEKHLKAARDYCVKVSMTLAGLTALALVAITPWGFVLANDLQGKMDNAVKEAVKELKAEQAVIKVDIAEIKQQQAQMNMGLNEILRSQAATNICRLLGRWSLEADRAEKGRLRVDVDAEQDKYRRLTGDYYPESRCGSLP